MEAINAKAKVKENIKRKTTVKKTYKGRIEKPKNANRSSERKKEPQPPDDRSRRNRTLISRRRGRRKNPDEETSEYLVE